jgi:hypothetical protein
VQRFSPLPTDRSALATRMTMARFHVVAIAAGLLLAVLGPSFAAKRTFQKSDTKNTVKSQSPPIKSNGSAIRPHNRDPYPYSRDPDPYAPGVNWPKGA